MSELIPNPQSEHESESARSAAGTEPAGSQHPTIMVRYDAAVEPSDRSGGGDGDESGADSGSGAAGHRAGALLGALARGLLAMVRTCMRVAHRYPRWALVIVFSILILGATASTRPGKPTPKAEIPSRQSAAAPSSGPDGKGDPNKDGKDPKENRTAIANAAPAPAANPREDTKDERGGEASAPTPSLDAAATPAPSAPKVAGAGPGTFMAAEGTPPRTDSAPADQGSVPAPPPPTGLTSATLVTGLSTGQPPAPAPPASSQEGSQASPATPSASAPPLNPELTPLPNSETHPSPTPAAESTPSTIATPGQSVESHTPSPGQELTLTGGVEGGNTPPPRDSADGSSGPTRQPAAPPDSGATHKPSTPPSELPVPGSAPVSEAPNANSSGPQAPTPSPPITQPTGPPTPRESAATPGPTNPESTNPEPTRPNAQASNTSRSGTGTTPDAESPRIDDDAARPETSHISQGGPEPPPLSPGSGPGPGLPGPGPVAHTESTKPGPKIARPEEAQGEKLPGAETPGPNLIKGEDLEPKHKGPSAGAHGTIGQPETLDPKEEGNRQTGEVISIPSRPQEPLTPTPASEPTAPASQENQARDEVAGTRPGTSAAEPSGSTPQSIRDPAEAGWIRIPNKGRIPSDMAGASAALGESAHPGQDPALDRHAHADESTRFETGSPTPRRRRRPGDTEGGALQGSAIPPTGLGRAVPGSQPPVESRADAESSRVEPSVHIVARGENFWTISRLYYGSARYYRALWKANAQKYPNINEIYIDDVILIPAPEDLDSALVMPSRPRAVAGRDEGSTRDQVAEVDGPAPAGTERLESFPTMQIARTSDESGSNRGRRPGRADAELELPVGDADRAPARGGRVPKVDGVVHEDDDGPATRLTARPRNPAPIDRPVYKVRRYDTLRSIARDALGDSHRADEIYEINRDFIADPTRLIPGQLLELPEDADSRRVTIRERYRGS